MLHRAQDEVSLALATVIARRLAARPEWIELARTNLAAWKRANEGSPGLVAAYAEWDAILSLPLPEVAAILMEPTERGQRLRQSNPFAGALTPEEVWQVKRSVRDATRAA
jgi:hypothetical protein